MDTSETISIAWSFKDGGPRICFFCFQHQFSAFATLVSGFGSGSILITTRWARGPPTSYKWSNGVITSISTVISSVIHVFVCLNKTIRPQTLNEGWNFSGCSCTIGR